MKKLTNYGKMLICMALVLVLSIGATIGITMTYFGDSKSGSVEIKIGASIYFATEGGVGVAVQDGTAAIVPTQSVEVDTTLKIMSSSDTNVTKGVLKVIPSLSEDLAGASLTLTDGETYDVYLGGSTTKSDSAVMVVANNALYLVKASDTSTLYEITPSTSGLSVKFSVPVTFSKDINNDLSGQSCTITMKGIVLQSNISGVAQTITAFEPYFDMMDPGPPYTVTLNGDPPESYYQRISVLYYAVDGSSEVSEYIEGEEILVENKIWISTDYQVPDWTMVPNKIIEHSEPTLPSSYPGPYFGTSGLDYLLFFNDDNIAEQYYGYDIDLGALPETKFHLSAILTITENGRITFCFYF